MVETSNELICKEEEEVITLKDDRVPVSVVHATSVDPETAQNQDTMDRHVRLPTETSVDIMLPSIQVSTYESSREASEPLSTLSSTPLPGPVSASIENLSVADKPIELSIPRPPSPVAHHQPWYMDLPAMIPTYPELRQLAVAGRSPRAAARSEKPSPGLFSYLFNNILTRSAAYTFDLWLMAICYFLAKVLKVRPRVSEKVMSWIS